MFGRFVSYFMSIPVFVILLFQLPCSIFVLGGFKLSYGKIWKGACAATLPGLFPYRSLTVESLPGPNNEIRIRLDVLHGED